MHHRGLFARITRHAVSRGIAAANFQARPHRRRSNGRARPARRTALAGRQLDGLEPDRRAASRGVGSANDRSRRDPIAPKRGAGHRARGQSWPERPGISLCRWRSVLPRRAPCLRGSDASDRDDQPVYGRARDGAPTRWPRSINQRAVAEPGRTSGASFCRSSHSSISSSRRGFRNTCARTPHASASAR